MELLLCKDILMRYSYGLISGIFSFIVSIFGDKK